MSSLSRDMWADDIAKSELLAPVAILREQAALLGPKTQNLIEAEVRSESSGGEMDYDFDLVAPALGNYRYRLFWVRHGPVFYPLILNVGGTSVQISCQKEFIEALGNILSSEETRKVVHSLIAQARA